jgi:hypothetical protein
VIDWISALKKDPAEWLLEDGDPSVRYFTLRDILDKPEEDASVISARAAIMSAGIVPAILSRQREPEYLNNLKSFYTDKYGGLVWSLITLAELGAERSLQIGEQCEYLFANSQERTDGGFSMHAAAKTGGGRQTEVIPCLTGNLTWCLLRFGYLGDPRLERAIGWLTRFMRFNDGAETEPQVPPYDRYDMCWGAHTCHMGVVKALKALGAIPEEKRTPEVNETIRKAAEFLLIHNIHKRSHDLSRISKPGWLKFGFPLMYQTDVLEILDILTSLGIHDDRMREAIDSVRTKQDGDGRWKLENVYDLLVPVEEKGKQSKWVTLRALRVLKRWHDIETL